MGLTPMLARETARFHGGGLSVLAYRQLVRALEGVFILSALGAGLLLFAGAGYMAQYWLQTSALPLNQVEMAIQLMAVTIAIRWLGGVYRSTLSGAERLVELSVFNAGIATLRTVGVLPVLLWVDASPLAFFLFQLGVTLLETLGLWLYAYHCLPHIDSRQHLGWGFAPLKNVYQFSLGIAFASLVWVLITQVDKLILSHLLPLADYGYFTLAVLAASSVTLLSTPISAALLPRMAKLEAEGNTATLIQLYRQTTQWVTLLASSAAITLALCAEPLLLLWTGDAQLAQQAAPVLRLYALGNGILAVCAFPYYLQYAKGNLQLHLIGNALFIVLLVPATVWATLNFGAIGAGYAWLFTNLLTFIVWLPKIHHKFAPSLNKHWYGTDILPIAIISGATGVTLHFMLSLKNSSNVNLISILLLGCVTLFLGLTASSEGRVLLKKITHKK
jgi:O-antigen/teichoic acid export membrane protein